MQGYLYDDLLLDSDADCTASSSIRITSAEIRKELANGKGTCCKSQDPAQQA